ncbi:MAG: hypothetical protein AAF738_01755 [Bacteroidota bacterium]
MDYPILPRQSITILKPTTAKKHLDNIPQNIQRSPNPNLLFLLLIGISSILIVSQFKGVSFIKENEDGELRLSEERQQKLQNRLDELEEGEQYVLRADVNGYYPCYNCGDTLEIFLYTSEVWKYGVTTKEQKGRYTQSYSQRNKLNYFPEFVGEIGECLKQEQIKIFNYAILPENVKRDIPLIRPPGNKRDF